MTREEKLLHRLDNAKKRYEVKCQELDECSQFSTQQAIKILDLESSTCENCKYIEYHDSVDEYACISDYMITKFNTYPQYPLFVDKDFGCNKWEARTVSTDTKGD